MADIPINEVTRRVQFTGNTTVGPFAFTFNILDDDDLVVYKNFVLQTITTDYTVSTNANGTGSITMTTALVASDVLTIIGGRALERTTDFVTAGDLLASSLNEQLDSLVIMAQQLDEKLDRSVKVDIGDQFTDLSLPAKADRLGTVLAFNATSGDPEAGPEIGDVSTIAAITADISTLADIEDGTDATDAIQTVAGISSNVSTVAGISGNVTTVAGISSNVTTVAGISANTTTVAGISSDVTTVAGISSDVTTVAGDAADIATVAGDSADIQSLAAVSTEIGLLGTADAIADMNTLATSAIVTDLDALADLATEIDALGDVTSDITTVSGISANVTTVAGVSANVTTVAGISSNVTTVAGVSSDVTTVAGISANVTTVAGDTTNIGTLAGISSDITTVSGISSNVTTVATNNANITTVASNITGVNSFAERYRVGASDPTTSLDEGDLAYNSTSNVLKYYNGTSWQSISPGIGSVADDSTPQLGGNLDLNSNNITGTGDISVTGAITADGLTVGDGHTFGGDAYDNLVIETSTGENAFVKTDNTFRVQDQNGNDRLRITASTGDVSFYEDTGTTAKFFWDASTQNLGIGTGSPQGDGLHIQASDNNNDDDLISLGFTYDANSRVLGTIGVHNSAGDTGGLKFSTKNSGTLAERMRIDSSGNLLVGRTSTSDTNVGGMIRPDGFVQSTRDGNIAADFNRNTSDGDIVRFSKGSSPVGSIRSEGGDIVFGNDTRGLKFRDSDVIPRDMDNTTADDVVSLGSSTSRFKDLYLGGGVVETTTTVTYASSIALTYDNGSIQTVTLTGNVTFTDSLADGEAIVLMLNAGASYTVTWTAVDKWVTSSGNAAPTLTANDTLVFWKIGSTVYGAYAGSYT